MKREYPEARWDPPHPILRAPVRRWRWRFRCPQCGKIAGELWVAAGRGARTPRPERVLLPFFMRPLSPLPDGRPLFGLATRLRNAESPTARMVRGAEPITRARVSRYSSVMANIGDAYRVPRKSPSRVRTATDYWVLALTGEEAGQPFVATCPNLDCRIRFRVDGPPAGDVLAQAADTEPDHPVR